MRVLVTRPEGDAKATAEALVARGHVPVLVPLFEIASLPVEIVGAFDAVAVTSANALRALDASAVAALCKTVLFAVGDATASTARGMGFTDIRSARGNGDALARLMARTLSQGGKILRLAGRDRRDGAFEALPPAFDLTTLVTYEAVARNSVPQGALDMLRRGEIDAVMHFSARAARQFGDLTQGILLPPSLLHVCISAAARDPRFIKAVVASRPTTEAMLTALDQNAISS